MYTFRPLIDTTLTHTGWYIWVVIALIILGMILFSYLEGGLSAGESFVTYLFFGVITAIIYDISYGGVKPINEPVNATFVGYQAEGYNEVRHHGKNHHRVDVHEIYVIYKINRTGNNIILDAGVGIEYPHEVILYKN